MPPGGRSGDRAALSCSLGGCATSPSPSPCSWPVTLSPRGPRPPTASATAGARPARAAPAQGAREARPGPPAEEAPEQLALRGPAARAPPSTATLAPWRGPWPARPRWHQRRSRPTPCTASAGNGPPTTSARWGSPATPTPSSSASARRSSARASPRGATPARAGSSRAARGSRCRPSKRSASRGPAPPRATTAPTGSGPYRLDRWRESCFQGGTLRSWALAMASLRIVTSGGSTTGGFTSRIGVTASRASEGA